MSCLSAYLFAHHSSALLHGHICPGKLQEKAARAPSLAIGTMMAEARNIQVEKNLLKSMLVFHVEHMLIFVHFNFTVGYY